MATIQVRFGRAVRSLREARGIGQEKFAAKAGIDRSYYSRIERGLANTSKDIDERIVKALKITWAELGSAIDEEK